MIFQFIKSYNPAVLKPKPKSELAKSEQTAQNF